MRPDIPKEVKVIITHLPPTVELCRRRHFFMKKNENIFDRGLIEALGEFASARQVMVHDVEYAR